MNQTTHPRPSTLRAWLTLVLLSVSGCSLSHGLELDMDSGLTMDAAAAMDVAATMDAPTMDDAADECEGVVCDATPAPTCFGPSTLRTFEDGRCTGGACDYGFSDTDCDFGCEDGACLPEPCPLVCEPEVLASDQGSVRRVAMDETHLYWTNWSSAQVVRSITDGGRLQVIASDQNFPFGIVLDATHVYWANAYEVVRARKDGSAREVLYTGPVKSVAIDDTYVYWGTGSDGRVMRARKDGSGAQTLASGQDYPMRVAVDDTHVYWTNFGENGQLMRALKDGTLQETVAAPGGRIRELALDTTHVYWTVDDTGRVMRALKDGTSPQTLASGDAVLPSTVFEG